MKMLKGMSLFATAAALCLTTAVNAQGMDSTTTTTTTTDSMASSNVPVAVSGTVLRYYVDRAGFVSAMDVQTADGVRMVRFSPSLAQKLTMMYPVGSTASVYVTSSMSGGMTRYDLAGVGATMPVPGAVMQPVMVTDLDVLKSEPFINIGAQQSSFEGKLTGIVTDPGSGEVLALVIEKDDMKHMVRVPMQNRLIGTMAPEGVTPLFKGSMVKGRGYEEASRYGAVSPYGKRIVATGLSVDGRSVGALGFGRISNRDTLFGGNIDGLAGVSPDEVNASASGYTTYMMQPAPAPAPAS